VLRVLETQRHYTYGVLPGSSIKYDVDYNVYTRQIPKFSDNCEYSKQDLLDYMYTEDRRTSDVPIGSMIGRYQRAGVTGLVLTIVLPVSALCSGGWPAIPMAFIALAI
jgi:hypothetical protein